MNSNSGQFHYEKVFQSSSKDSTQYNLLTNKFVETTNFNGQEVLKVDAEGLSFLSEIAQFLYYRLSGYPLGLSLLHKI